jgi:tRNA wybutosine-synthesizing protein 1
MNSCCILLAREDRFKINEEWYTWMNYYRSDELNEEHIYKYRLLCLTKTSEWALYQSKERI